MNPVPDDISLRDTVGSGEQELSEPYIKVMDVQQRHQKKGCRSLLCPFVLQLHIQLLLAFITNIQRFQTFSNDL